MTKRNVTELHSARNEHLKHLIDTFGVVNTMLLELYVTDDNPVNGGSLAYWKEVHRRISEMEATEMYEVVRPLGRKKARSTS